MHRLQVLLVALMHISSLIFYLNVSHVKSFYTVLPDFSFFFFFLNVNLDLTCVYVYLHRC